MNSIIIQSMKKLLTLSLSLLVLVTFAEISAAQSCIQPPSGSVAWWPMNETSGITVTDIVGGHNGTSRPAPIGAFTGPGPVTSTLWPLPTFPVGMVNNSLFFYGNRHIEVPSHSDLEPGTGDFTIEAWAIYAASGNGQLLTVAQKNTGATAAFGNTLDGWRFVIRDYSPTQGGVSFIGALGVGGSVEQSITPNTWHHVSATLSTNASGFRIVKIYVDGVSSGQVGLNGNIASTAPLLIGSNDIEAGQIAVDELGFFNRALTQSEIQDIFNAGSAGKCVSPPSGLVSWWPGEGNANDIQDGNNGTLINGTTFAPGKVGQAFSFDGVDDGISILKMNNLNMGPSDFSIEAWVNVAQTPTPQGVIFMNYAGVPAYLLWITPDAKAQVFFRPSVPSLGGSGNDPSVGATGTTSLNDGQWHHLVGVRNGATALIYVDGVLEGSATNPAVLTVNGGSVDTGGCLYARIGAVHTSNGHCYSLNPNPLESQFFQGLIDEVKIYNRALTASEIQGIFDTTPPDTTITSSPPSLSNSSSATFTFVSNEAGSTFQCKLDGGGFVACPSPKSYGGLGNGSHTFRVRTIDPAGNVDPSPASFTWTVDTIPPQTIITSAVNGNGAAVFNGGSTLSKFITFTFGGADNVGVVGFKCSLDGALYTPCSNPLGYPALSTGIHIFNVRAIDAAGNVDPSPASFTWSVVNPAQAIQDLITAIGDMGLPFWVANSLSATLNNIDPNNKPAACGKMNAFISKVNVYVQNGQMTPAQASQLLQAANAIRASLGC